eukprot:CAMPEP_0194569264 /NCGR_PEP_ID=MMETSP0292-20121207/7051_1 /TAXON_ID=39354 /ORGANISM="Heterosigma akashiwo, Strain CCMP2393" /LENGTH=283 /DNA_ID=CAMNT_0039419483 /DNA_START=26 /DNA_END=874 /DNA_ORIENTATION=-
MEDGRKNEDGLIALVPSSEKLCDEDGKEYVAYAVNVKLTDGEMWTLMKRYSEFERLYKVLMEQYNFQMLAQFSFPKKDLFFSGADDVIEKRRKAFSEFCQLLPLLAPRPPEVAEFLRLPPGAAAAAAAAAAEEAAAAAAAAAAEEEEEASKPPCPAAGGGAEERRGSGGDGGGVGGREASSVGSPRESLEDWLQEKQTKIFSKKLDGNCSGSTQQGGQSEGAAAAAAAAAASDAAVAEFLGVTGAEDAAVARHLLEAHAGDLAAAVQTHQELQELGGAAVTAA